MPRARADWMASKITAAGSPPCEEITSTLLRLPHSASCFARGGAEGVAGCQQHALAFGLETVRQLADGGGLAGPLTPASMMTKGFRGAEVERALQRREQIGEFLFERFLELAGIGEAITLDPAM